MQKTKAASAAGKGTPESYHELPGSYQIPENTTHLDRFLRVVRLLQGSITSHTEGKLHATCRCPAHEDNTASLSVTLSDTVTLFYCHAGCNYQEIVRNTKKLYKEQQNRTQEIRKQDSNPIAPRNTQSQSHLATHKEPSYINRSERETRSEIKEGERDAGIDRVVGSSGDTLSPKRNVKSKHLKDYIYHDEEGCPVFVIEKYVNTEGEKTFLTKKLEKTGDNEYQKVVGLSKEERLLYRLPYIKKAKEKGWPVFYVEGEKDADNCYEHLKVVATTNPHGAGKWLPQYTEQLRGVKTLILIPDNDSPGIKAVENLSRSIAKALPETTVVTLSPFEILGAEGSSIKGADISDWIDAGHTREELITLVKEAKERGNKERTRDKERTWDSETGIASTLPDYLEEENERIAEVEVTRENIPFTDLGNAERLLTRFEGTLHYVVEKKVWTSYDPFKNVWSFVDQSAEYRALSILSKELHIAAQEMPVIDEYAEKERKAAIKNALGLQAAGQYSSVGRVAQSLPGFYISLNSFDADAHLLNCKNGVVNLKTGELRAARASDYLSKQAPISYNPRSEYPEMWSAFLDRCFELGEHDSKGYNDKEEVLDYIQKLCGYALIGDNSQQLFLLLHGKGGSGKSTFVGVLRGILGEEGEGGYAANTSPDTFCENRYGGGGSSPTPELAKLAGTRLVEAGELKRGARLADNILKAISGSGRITARGLHQNPVTYEPRFLLVLEANNAVYIDPSDTGMWRRAEIIPFNNSITDTGEQIGKYENLLLMKESEGILAWMVEGAMRLLREGLVRPERFNEGIAAYKSQMDSIMRFVQDMCEVEEGHSVEAAKLYEAYKLWCEAMDEKSMKYINFKQELETRLGFEHKVAKKNKRAARCFIGLSLPNNWRSSVEGSNILDEVLEEDSTDDEEEF